MAGQPEHRYFLGQPQHRYPLIAPSDDPFTLNGGTTGTGNGPAQGLHLLNEPQHGFQSGSEASTNTLLAAYSIDPHTQQPYEPIEDYQVELLYRGDPGWYFQSLAGCVYHLVNLNNIHVPNVSSTKPFNLSCKNPEELPSAYKQIYKRWLANWSIPYAVHEVVFQESSDGKFEPHDKFTRGVTRARQELRESGSVQAATQLFQDSMLQPHSARQEDEEFTWTTEDLHHAGELWDGLLPPQKPTEDSACIDVALLTKTND